MTAEQAAVVGPVEIHASATMYQRATIEEPLEIVFSVRLVPRLYSKGHGEK
jgi:hypothetical protein